MPTTNTDLASQFQSTTDELIQLIKKFNTDSFHRKPSEDKWSAAEVAEHLLIFDIRLTMILPSATEPADREINEKVPVFTARVSNRENKIDAPPFLIPTQETTSQTDLIEKILSERKKIIAAIELQDLSLISKEYPHRLFGELTAQEWILLVDTHTRRHMEQLTELL